jgi:Ni,Fe-hydrogenase III small subunit/Pyruvate/2-oxoacid:ferredoxin oxidoreductase delta subunit
MFDMIRVIINQGFQAIKDIRKAVVHEKFRGYPVMDVSKCSICSHCEQICPSRAITAKPLRIDLGKCVFCGDCERECPRKAIAYTNFHKISSTAREHLVVEAGKDAQDYAKEAVKAREDIKKIFGRSLKLRQVSAGGCNGCEMELGACSNVNFDMGRFGIDFTASPRHADGIVITGPVSENMAKALEDTYQSTPDPKIIIAVGSCAISGGVFADSPALDRGFFSRNPVDLYVPGCPVHPLTFINGILDFLDRK